MKLALNNSVRRPGPLLLSIAITPSQGQRAAIRTTLNTNRNRL